MEILFLGTGAADWPGELPDADGMQSEYRRFTSVLIDGCILIDPGPHAPEALAAFGADASKIRTVLITHSHGDHFQARTLDFLAQSGPIEVYGDGGYPEKLPRHPNLHFHALQAYEPQNLSFGRLTAVESTHVVEDTNERCLHYILERDGRTLFYGADGAWFGGGTWYEMEKHRYDCVILDATFGDDASRFGNSRHIWFYHNSVSMLKVIHGAFLDKRMADDHTSFVATHLSRTFYPTFEEAEGVLEPMGFIVSRDGLRLHI